MSWLLFKRGESGGDVSPEGSERSRSTCASKDFYRTTKLSGPSPTALSSSRSGSRGARNWCIGGPGDTGFGGTLAPLGNETRVTLVNGPFDQLPHNRRGTACPPPVTPQPAQNQPAPSEPKLTPEQAGALAEKAEIRRIMNVL